VSTVAREHLAMTSPRMLLDDEEASRPAAGEPATTNGRAEFSSSPLPCHLGCGRCSWGQGSLA
jgi:hypothetical protein